MTEPIETSLAVPAQAAPVAVGRSYAELERMAHTVVTSRLFGVATIEQAIVLMMVAEAEGMHPVDAFRQFYVVNGRPVRSAESMLAKFQQRGGHVEWLAYTADVVTGRFTAKNGDTVDVTWDSAKANRAGLLGKDNWKKNPESMRASRCISEGVRRVDPGCVLGIYIADEAEEMEPRGAISVEPLDDVEYMTADERREQRARVAATPPAPRQSEPASEAVKSVAQQKLAAAKAASASVGYRQPHFPSGKGKELGRFELHATGKGATFTGPGAAGSVILECEVPAKDNAAQTVVYFSAAKLREYTGLAEPHTYTGPLEAVVTRFPDGTCQLDSLSIPGAPSDELPPVVSLEELQAEVAAKGAK